MLKAHIDQSWSSWFEGIEITYEGEDCTVLRGPLADEAAMYGVLIKIRDLALPLLSLCPEDADK